MKVSARLLLIIVTATLVMAAACGNRAFERQVDLAESLMESAPDSALAIAESLRPDSRAERARAALLLTKARYKAYVPLTDDSLIALAADFYAGHNDSLETQALFFLGETYRTLSDFGRAIIAGQEAEDIAIHNKNYFYAAQAQRLLADIYRMNYDYDNELAKRLKSIEYYHKAQKPKYEKWEKVFYASALGSSGDDKSAISYLIDIAQDTIGADEYFTHEYKRASSISCFTLGDYAGVISNLRNSTHLMSSKDWTLLSLAFTLDNQIQSAFSCIDSAKAKAYNPEDFCAALYSESQIHLKKKDYYNAYKLLILSDSIQNQVRDSLLIHPYNSLVADNYRLKFLNKQYENRIAHYFGTILIISLLFITLLLAFILISYRNKNKLQTAKIESLKQDIQNLERTLSASNEKISKEERKAVSLNSFRKLINNISYELTTTTSNYSSKIQRLNNILNQLSDEESTNSLKDLVNNLYCGELDEIVASVPSLNKRQKHIIIFSALGFSSVTICSLTGINDSRALNQAKYRIREIIKNT